MISKKRQFKQIAKELKLEDDDFVIEEFSDLIENIEDLIEDLEAPKQEVNFNDEELQVAPTEHKMPLQQEVRAWDSVLSPIKENKDEQSATPLPTSAIKLSDIGNGKEFSESAMDLDNIEELI